MRTRGAAALLVAVGLLIVPAAALFCDARDAASMACCKGDMAGCNQPGKSQDCCRQGVSDRDATINVVQANRLPKPAAGSFHGVFVAACIPPSIVLGPSGILAASCAVSRVAPSPPLICVLRV